MEKIFEIARKFRLALFIGAMGAVSIYAPLNSCDFDVECFNDGSLVMDYIPDFKNSKEFMEAENLHEIFRSDQIRDCFKKSIVKFGLSCKESDIYFSEIDSLKIKICQCSSTKSQDKYKKIENCKSNCNTTAAIVGAAVCYNLPRPCQIACVAAIEGLRRRCEWCCETSNFYDSCVRPFHSFDPPPCEWNE